MTTFNVADHVVVPMVGRSGPRAGERAGRCRCRLEREARAHHDRLLALEADPDEVLELLELAVTWHELDWSEAGVVPPEAWHDFAAGHDWDDPDRVARLFALAADIALRAPNPAPRVTRASGCRLTDAELLACEL